MKKILATVAISALLSTNVYAADQQSSDEYDAFMQKMEAKALTGNEMKSLKGEFDAQWLFGGAGFG